MSYLNNHWFLLQDIASWEAALKHAAGSHKTLVHAVEQYKRLLEESKAKLQQERASQRALLASPAHCCMTSWLIRSMLIPTDANQTLSEVVIR